MWTVSKPDAVGLPPAKRGRPRKAAAAAEPGPQEMALMQEMLIKHYRDWLDSPIPALGNKSPRQTARDPKNRVKIEKLLGQLALNPPMDLPIDLSFLWEELGLQKPAFLSPVLPRGGSRGQG